MSTGFGHNAFIGIGAETTYGTAVAPTKFLQFDEESIKLDQKYLPKPTIYGVGVTRRVKSRKSVGGGLKLALAYTGFELLHKHIMGAVATTGAGPYTHTFTRAAALPTGLTLHVNRDAASVGVGTAFNYEGCQVNKATWSAGREENFLSLALEFVGEDCSNGNIATPSFATFDGITWDTIACELQSTAFPCQSFEVTLDNNLAADRFKLGQLTRIGLGRAGASTVSGKFTLEFQDLVVFNYWKNLTEVDLKFTATSGTKVFRIQILAAQLDMGDPNTSSGGPIQIEIGFTGYNYAGDGTEMEILITNSTAGPI